MRIVFMGTPEFAVPCLKALTEREGTEVVGVFTQPDRPRGRGKKEMPSPVKAAAAEAGIPVFQPQRIRRDGVEDLKRLRPDLCVTAAFGQILSQEILDIPELGNVNVHASILPRHRGSAPIARAIMSGDEYTGVTTMMMDAGIDTGDMLLCEQVKIGDTETCGELTGRLSILGARVLMRTLDAMENGTLRRIAQNNDESTYDPMLSKEMSRVDFTMSADTVKACINGLNPWPCVSVPYEGERLKLLRAKKVEGKGRPGEIIASGTREGLVIACGDQAVRILELQAPGGKKMRAEDFLAGHSLSVGTWIGAEE